MTSSLHLAHPPRPADTVYRGVRREGRIGEFVGVQVTIDDLHFPIPPAPLRCASAFEWGYGGAGPRMLARAIIFDATGDARLARRAAVWFMWATTACWGSKWSITAGRVREWLAQFDREWVMDPLAPTSEDFARSGLASGNDSAAGPVVVGPIRVHAKHAVKGPHASPAGAEGGGV